jgi:hypothetical protein
VLGIVYRTLATHLTKKAGYTKTTAYTGARNLDPAFRPRTDKIAGSDFEQP